MDRSARSCDLLEPDALFQTAKLLQTHSDADFIYSEEDKFSEEGFAAPMLKPDWSPDFFLACNYLCHFLPNSMARRITISFSAPSSGPIGFITFRGCCIIGGKAQAPARLASGKNPGNSKPDGAPMMNTSYEKASRVTYTPFAKLYHHESGTRRPTVEPLETEVMRQRWPRGAPTRSVL